jgi:sugar phosphate isomerase/epimerase
MGYNGIELRGLLDEIDVTRRPEFSPANLGSTRRMLEQEGIEVCCLGSSVHLLHPGDAVARAREREEFDRYLELSVALFGSPIRVFGGAAPGGLPEEEAIAWAAEELEVLAERAQKAGTQVLLESHDFLLAGRRLAAVVGRCRSRGAGALWDVFNSQIPAEESLERTYSLLRPFIRHVHVKDGHIRNGRYAYTLLGAGAIGYAKVLSWLLSDGYSGWLSVEWEKRWHPDLEDPETALPQYAEGLKSWMDGLGRLSSHLD